MFLLITLYCFSNLNELQNSISLGYVTSYKYTALRRNGKLFGWLTIQYFSYIPEKLQAEDKLSLHQYKRFKKFKMVRRIYPHYETIFINFLYYPITC